MKKFTALALVAGLSATGAQAQYNLLYDPADGNVTLEVTGTIISYVLEDADAPGQFIAANHQQTSISGFEFQPGQFITTGAITSEQIQLFESLGLNDLNNDQTRGPGNFDIGNVLPAGLDKAGVEAAIDGNAIYNTDKGAGNEGTWNVVVVPEPSSLALIGLGGLLVARRRRG